jgi:hypothetical protein
MFTLFATACMRFEVIMAVTISNTVFWNIGEINPKYGGGRFFQNTNNLYHIISHTTGDCCILQLQASVCIQFNFAKPV